MSYDLYPGTAEKEKLGESLFDPEPVLRGAVRVMESWVLTGSNTR